MERSRYLYRTNSRYQKTWKEKLKDFIRSFVAFMFTNVGIIGLVVGYTVAGAFMFIAIEGEQSAAIFGSVTQDRDEAVIELWELTYRENIFSRETWRHQVTDVLTKYQEKFVEQAQKGYDPNPESWSFSGAFLYSLTVITTIGYGNLAPRTPWGKIATVLYAIAGMPLFLLYLSNIGDILAKSFKWTYFKMCLCKGCPGSSSFRRRKIHQDIQMTPIESHQDDFLPHREWQMSHAEESSRRSRKSSPEGGETENDDSDDEESEGEEDEESVASQQYDPQAVTVPITLCLAIMVGYVCGGAILFDSWEDWGTLDGSYFCFISLSTIGFGDIVPGDEIYRKDNTYLNISFIATSVYLMLGMALIAMCFNLMQEEVIHKTRTCIKTCKNIFSCCRRDVEAADNA